MVSPPKIRIDKFHAIAFLNLNFPILLRIDEPAVPLDDQVQIAFTEFSDQVVDSRSAGDVLLKSVDDDVDSVMVHDATPCTPGNPG